MVRMRCAIAFLIAALVAATPAVAAGAQPDRQTGELHSTGLVEADPKRIRATCQDWVC
jgi:hypothetical protein